MLNNKLLDAICIAQSNRPLSEIVEPQSNRHRQPALVAIASALRLAPVCPSCGAAGCNQDAGVKAHARYQCPQCFKVFCVSSVSRQARRDDYERWLADIAS